MKRCVWMSIVALVSFAFAASPIQNAETIRSGLLQAQLELMTNPEEAKVLLEDAKRAFADLDLGDETLAAQFGRAEQALNAGDNVAFAAARATLWTALLHASYEQVQLAIQHNDAETAKRWLSLREFRQATRFSRPNADATLAVKKLAEGSLSQEEALATVRADLLDTYQARLSEALSDVVATNKQNFAMRGAEAAGLATGYFTILKTVYTEQRGEDAAAQAEQAFTNLVANPDENALKSVNTALQGFRAAPLSDKETLRRAGQMMRFISLVAVEYGRGIRNGQVAVDLEIREAISFRDGAAAAFTDLRSSLEQQIDKAKTEQVATIFTNLEEQLAAASQKTSVAAPADVRAQTDELTTLLKEVMPTEWQKQDSSADFDVIQEALTQMENAVKEGQYELAASARLEAYAILESGPEARLIAFAPQFKPILENLFWYGQDENKGLAYLIEQHAPLADIQATRAELSRELVKAEKALSGSKAPGAITTNAAIIVFREGLEAVIILASLMASFKTAANRRYRKPMWLGAGLAFLASAVTWFVMQGALLAFARYGERVEAVVSILAIIVLILITNWFFHDSYWTDWMASFHKKKGELVKTGIGASLGFITLGFTSIYREGFETVLFLQALVLESNNVTVLLGTAIGLVGTALIGYVIFQVQTKLPYKKMFIVTAAMIGAVLLIMVGNTTHVLQVVGWLPTHPLRFVEFSYWTGLWFGLYATWEGLAAQAIAAVFVLGSYFLAEYLKERSRHTKIGAVSGKPVSQN
ncbi:MAG: FTR1 family iron permease [Trueperaceae bacterium]